MTALLDIFRALADPTRLRIVQLLRSMELSVGEVAQVVAQSQPRVSRHIRILVEAQLVERRKEGNWVFLRLGASQLCRDLIAMFDNYPAPESEDLWRKADLARLAAVRAERVRAADSYFARHAEEWDAIRSLHLPEAAVEAAMLKLADTHGKSQRHGRLLDIGTGTGRMVQLFGPDATTVVAIDRSPEMLRLARAKLPDAGTGVGKYDLVLGDFSSLPLPDASVDFITVHQVLHYAQEPAGAIAEAARVLAPGGCLMIADFAPHEREELRASDQHARLGFSDAQIASWFDAVGLSLDATETLPGGDLTVKLWLGRRTGATTLPIKGRNQA